MKGFPYKFHGHAPFSYKGIQPSAPELPSLSAVCGFENPFDVAQTSFF